MAFHKTHYAVLHLALHLALANTAGLVFLFANKDGTIKYLFKSPTYLSTVIKCGAASLVRNAFSAKRH